MDSNQFLMSFIISILSVIILAAPLEAQDIEEVWIESYGGTQQLSDKAVGLAIDADGNIIVAGYAAQTGSYWDYTAIKYNPAGDSIWVTAYDGFQSGADEARAMTIDGDGNVYITGGFVDTLHYPQIVYDIGTIKINSGGGVAWDTRYNSAADLDDKGQSICLDESGNIYVAGWSYIEGSDHSVLSTIKYAAGGGIQWVSEYDGPGGGQNRSWGIAVDQSGFAYVVGESEGEATNLDMTTIKYDCQTGDTLWTACYNGSASDNDAAYALALDDSGHVYVAGVVAESQSDNDGMMIKYDSEGDTIWTRSYNGSGNRNDYLSLIAVDSEGNIIACGESENADGNGDFIVLKYDPSGSLLWEYRYDRPETEDSPSAMTLDETDNIYVTGDNYITVKINAEGNAVWDVIYNVQGNEYATGIALDDSNNVYVTGYTGSIIDYDFTTIKYQQSEVGISPWQLANPCQFTLVFAYPNPFNPSAIISFDLPVARQVKLEVFDMQGRSVTSHQSPTTSHYSFTFDAGGLASGMYFYRLTAGEFRGQGKMVLMK